LAEDGHALRQECKKDPAVTQEQQFPVLHPEKAGDHPESGKVDCRIVRGKVPLRREKKYTPAGKQGVQRTEFEEFGVLYAGAEGVIENQLSRCQVEHDNNGIGKCLGKGCPAALDSGEEQQVDEDDEARHRCSVFFAENGQNITRNREYKILVRSRLSMRHIEIEGDKTEEGADQGIVRRLPEERITTNRIEQVNGTADDGKCFIAEQPHQEGDEEDSVCRVQYDAEQVVAERVQAGNGIEWPPGDV